MSSSFLIGCDPEVFVKKGGVFQSAYNLIKGDKKNPQKVPYGAVQVDGMALEFNIDPAATCQEFVFNVQSVLDTMKSMVPDYEVVAEPVADFGMEYLRTQPAAALELGCDPDYDAWTGAANPRPDGEVPFRTASGHIHIGWTQDADINDPAHREDAFMVVRQLDHLLGCGSLSYDKNTKRRQMYGKAGACRIKPYGVEYRTLSNAWLVTKERMEWVYNTTIRALNDLDNGVVYEKTWGKYARDSVNSSQFLNAKRVLSYYKVESVQ